jgi:imidazoleglycerol-phosphate dehydratase
VASRSVEVKRVTKETDVSLALDIDRGDRIEVKTGIPFFDHLLTSMAFHGRFGLTLAGEGDLEVDGHHLVEDVGLVLGEALAGVLEKTGPVARFAHAVIPMDEALAEVSIDVCGRPTLVYKAGFPQQWVGTFDTALIKEFFSGLSAKAGISLHAELRVGENSHHMAEALFKALGKAIAQAYRPGNDQMSSKGRIG